ncbi:MAG: tRNA epoxyqueuosine(34) reductase QueG, partial [Verrucomicrobiota bacterium]
LQRMDPAARKRILEQLARADGADAFGVVGLPAELRADFYRQWIARGHHGTMGWMERNTEKRADPAAIVEGAQSVIVLGYNYYQPEPPRRGRIAKYALGADYHKVLLRKLKRLCTQLREWDGAQKPYVDTGPNLEKPLAALAGLGWQAKNTLVINPQSGQWLFLGVIITTLELPPDEPVNDRCGTCTRCLDVCPTQAITAPYQLDARRCLSYLTIEHRGSFPREFRRALGDHLFGCDDCLDVCPWNRWAQVTREAKFAPRPYPDLREMLSWDDATFRAVFAGSPLRRPGLQGWKRNVCVVLGNIGTLTDVPALEAIARGDDALLAEHAAWALSEIHTRHPPSKHDA